MITFDDDVLPSAVKRYSVRRIDHQNGGVLMEGSVFETDNLGAAVDRRDGNLTLVIIDRHLAELQAKQEVV